MTDKKELSKFYMMGYKTGYHAVLLLLKSIMTSEDYDTYSAKIKSLYDNYPGIEPLELNKL